MSRARAENRPMWVGNAYEQAAAMAVYLPDRAREHIMVVLASYDLWLQRNGITTRPHPATF